MNVLIVHAHPEPQSFTAALRDQAVETFRAQGHQVQVSDLYAMGWNPVASADDFTQRENPEYLVYALEQRQGVKRGAIAADIQQELDKLLWADLLVLNFPIFWFSAPAILKGWIDRVLVSGVCYGGKRFYDQGGLAGKKALVTVTLGGREHMFGEGAIHGPLEDMLRPILRGTLAYSRFRGAAAVCGLARALASAPRRGKIFAAIPAAPGAACGRPAIGVPPPDPVR